MLSFWHDNGISERGIPADQCTESRALEPGLAGLPCDEVGRNFEDANDIIGKRIDLEDETDPAVREKLRRRWLAGSVGKKVVGVPSREGRGITSAGPAGYENAFFDGSSLAGRSPFPSSAPRVARDDNRNPHAV